MADLETNCCTPETQDTCCDPEEKDTCCGDGCECGAG
jgi:hypothetical protein